jgi:hypothetical protein
LKLRFNHYLWRPISIKSAVKAQKYVFEPPEIRQDLPVFVQRQPSGKIEE